jgi:menaquinone-9 beta-reductase
MIEVDTIIVGGGPAGSSCAWQLRRHGIDCLVVDRAEFPRLKLCAGWVTPKVLRDLEIEPGEYPAGFLTFDALRLSFRGFGITLKTKQHSIRRIEFDEWLLRRSGASVSTHNVRQIRSDGDRYVIDDTWRCRHLVGAGGTRCPVHRTFFRELAPRDEALQAAVLEEEFPCNWSDGTCRLWFFDHGLPGYSWYVPKAGGHLNVGIGAMAAKLKSRHDSIRPHWRRLTGKLAAQGLVGERAWETGGYTYYLRPRQDHVRRGGAFLVGDAAGLSTRDLCEGIGPAVRSGLLAADAIASGGEYSLARVRAHSVKQGLVRRGLDWAFCGRA